MADRIGPVTIEGTRLVFRNFMGEKGKFNKNGDRTFCAVLPEELALMMINDGWNVKRFKPREDDVEEPGYYISVKIGENSRPPKIVLINSRGRKDIPVKDSEILDWLNIAEADLIINPYPWSIDGNSGIRAYLGALYVTINEDELEQKYANVPEVGASDFENGEEFYY